MIRLARYGATVIALTAGALGVRALAAAAARTDAAPPDEPVTRFVAGGIPVIYKHITANDVVAVQLYLKGGSTALAPATAGIEHLLGEASTHGTTKYSKDRFAALATSTGTNIGAMAGHDYTVLSAQAVRQNWDAAWDLFTQAALYPTFPADEVEQVRNQIVNELKQRADDPDSRLDLLADSMQYAGHPYAVDAEGTTASIAKLTRDDLIRWHKRRLTKENLLLVVVGNVARDDVAGKVASAFASLPAQGGAAPRAAALSAGAPSVQTVKQELPTNYIMGVFAAPAPSHPDFPALRVAIRVLSDRLFEEVRTKRNLTYAVSAGLDTRAANRGDLYVTAVNPDTTIRVMIAEVKRLQSALVPAQLLAETINVFATQTWMSQQTDMGQASQLGLWEIQGGGWQNAARYVDRLRAVTPQQVQRAAQTYLRNVRFVVIGDPAKVNAMLFKSL